MKRLWLGLWVLCACGARPPDWSAQRADFQRMGDEFNRDFHTQATFTLLTEDLDHTPVTPEQVNGPSTLTMGNTCGWVLRVLRQFNVGNSGDGKPDPYFSKAFGGVKQVTCQYAHVASNGGTPGAPQDPPADNRVVFVPATGDGVREIHIVLNRQMHHQRFEEKTVVDAVEQRFPDGFRYTQ